MTSAKRKATTPRRRSTGKAAARRRGATAERTDLPAKTAAVNSTAAAARGPVEAAGAAADLASDPVDEWVEAGAIVAKGAEDIGKAWLRLTQRSMEDGAAAVRAILMARSLHEVVSLQSDYARTSLDTLVTESMRISELSVRVARAAMLPATARRDAAAERS